MFGCVFKGTFKTKACAVKVLHEIGMEFQLNLPDEGDGRKVQSARVNSFNRECKNLGLLEIHHPNVVELMAVCAYPGTNHNLPCLVMELLDCSLREYLSQTSPQIPTQISLSCDIGKALDYLHDKQLIHRDLCGDNIVLIKKEIPLPTAKITDFGMSRIFDPQKMSHSASVLGHRTGYLPPEGLTKEYDLSLDVHMFGVVVVQIVNAVKDVDSPKMRQELIDKIPESHPLKNVIDSCVLLDKNARPTAATLSLQLQALSAEIPPVEL